MMAEIYCLKPFCMPNNTADIRNIITYHQLHLRKSHAPPPIFSKFIFAHVCALIMWQSHPFTTLNWLYFLDKPKPVHISDQQWLIITEHINTL